MSESGVAVAGVVDLRDWRNPMPAAARLTLLEHAAPGPEVVAAVAGIDPQTLGEFEQVQLLRIIERQRHWLDAVQQPALAAVAGDATPTTGGAKKSPPHSPCPSRPPASGSTRPGCSPGRCT
jgi:hypothetical protein